METSKEYINIGIFGFFNSGKCSLSKSLTIACGSISTPNNFTYQNKNYFITPIPCSYSDYNEKYEFSSNICDIAIIVNDSGQEIHEYEAFKKNIILELTLKGVQNIIFCYNKIDKFNFTKEKFEENKTFWENFIYKEEKFLEIFPSNKLNTIYIPISANENWNIEEKSEEFLHCYNWYKGDSLLESLDKIEIPKFNHLVKFFIYDFYNDTDEGYFVISGKTLRGELNKNTQYVILPQILDVINVFKIDKLSNCEGTYVDNISSHQFCSIKINSKNVDFPTDKIRKGDIITEHEKASFESLSIFNTFEADILAKITKHENLPLITPGFQSMIIFGSFACDCVIESVLGEIGKIIFKSR